MSEPEEESIQLRKAVQHVVAGICGKEEEESGCSMSTQAIKALAEFTFLYATTSLAHDLDAFSSHANRKTINVEDVKLVVRKRPDLVSKLSEFFDGLSPNGKLNRPRKTSGGGVLRENNKRASDASYGVKRDSDSSYRGKRNSAASSGGALKLPSSDDSDLEANENPNEDSKQPTRTEASRKRSRSTGVAGRLLDEDSDSLDMDSDAENRKKPPKTKTIQNDHCSSFDESDVAQVQKAPPKKRVIERDSPTDDDSDVENAKKALKTKPAAKAIELDDSSTSSEESIPAEKKKQSSQLLKVLAGSLSFSGDEDSD